MHTDVVKPAAPVENDIQTQPVVTKDDTSKAELEQTSNTLKTSETSENKIDVKASTVQTVATTKAHEDSSQCVANDTTATSPKSPILEIRENDLPQTKITSPQTDQQTCTKQKKNKKKKKKIRMPKTSYQFARQWKDLREPAKQSAFLEVIPFLQ